jgi:hypothetical protein
VRVETDANDKHDSEGECVCQGEDLGGAADVKKIHVFMLDTGEVFRVAQSLSSALLIRFC